MAGMIAHLVRHAEKAPGPGDPGITLRGRTQALRAAQRLAPEQPAALFTSPQRRAAQTAAFMSARLGLVPRRDARLRERANWGDAPGQSFADFVAEWERCNEDRERIPPGGDSARAAGERLDAFLREQWRRAPDATVIAVTHGGLIVDFLLNQMSRAELARLDAEYTFLRNTSITSLAFDGQAYRVIAVGDAAHLVAT
ncbi:MAG TPA: histidine phosphatase family protein [Limnochordia bacterium]|nr:histidine phosphatase family protein [Limnochordia bacterium]